MRKGLRLNPFYPATENQSTESTGMTIAPNAAG